MSRLALLAVVAFAACNATKNPVTSNGTTLVDWDYTKATRAGFAKATVGARTSKDFVVDSKPEGAPPIQFDVHVELAPVDFEEGGETVHHTAPVAIKISVKDNTGWDLAGKCEEGPNYQFGPVDAKGRMETPAAMREDCDVSEHRHQGTVLERTWQIGFTLNLYGDGNVKPFGENVTVRPK